MKHRKRMTRQKQIVLKIVQESYAHLTARDVLEKARQVLPHISLGTVYRNLEDLAEQGLIKKIVLSDQIARYDKNTGEHYHIRCVECRRVEDLPLSSFDNIYEKVQRSTGFQVLDHHLEVVGLCPACRTILNTRGGGNQQTG